MNYPSRDKEGIHNRLHMVWGCKNNSESKNAKCTYVIVPAILVLEFTLSKFS
jgi:hypothetical protein